MKGRAVFTAFALALSSFAIVVSGAAGTAPAGADTVGPIGFEGHSLGSVYGNQGWAGSDSCGIKDQAIVDTSLFPAAPAEFGTKSFRFSNAVTGGCFTDPTTPSTANDAGEAGALRGGKSNGPSSDHFEAEWTFASATGDYQEGLNVAANPDRGDGARMSYVGMRHLDGSNLELAFYDVQGVDPPATPTPCGPGCANFVETSLGTYDPTVPHSIKLSMDFVDDGPDVVQVYVDGNLVHTGTSWEDYYKLDTESSPSPGQRVSRTVDSLAFRATGPAAPANAGQGFLIDNVTVSTGPEPAASQSSVSVSPGSLNGWGFLQESPTAPESGTFAAGPEAAPLGAGSVQLAVTGSEGHIVGTQAYNGTRLADITDLSYSTYQSGPTLAVTLQMGVRYRPTDTAFGGRLVFEPYQTVGTVGAGWQTWSPLEGKWWASNTSANGTGLGPSGECSQASPCQWSRVLELWPDAIIGNGANAADGPLLLKVGSAGSWPGFTGNADNVTIGVNNASTTYDFEPACSTTCYVDGSVAASGDGNPGSPFKTIQEGIDAVDVDGDVIVAEGTYDEHVTIGKSLHLDGAGDTTVVDPSTDGPAITITSGGTSETDRLVVSNLKTTGAGGGRPNGQGIRLAVPTAAGHVTFDHVTSTGNTGDGLLQNGVGALEDIVVESSTFSGNTYGGYAVTSGAGEITKVRVDNSHFDDNGTWGWSVFVATSGANRPTMTDVVVEDSTFNGNGHKGIYLERADHTVLQRLQVISSGDGDGLPPEPGFTPHAAGIDINLKYREYTDISLLDSTITGSGAGDATNGGAVLIKQRDDAPSYSSPAASVSDVTLSGNTISNNPVTGLRFGEPGKTNAGPTDVHVNQNTITDNTGIGFNAENTSVQIDGECNFYGTSDGPSGEGLGTGDDVSANIDFDPWKIAADSPCPPNAPTAPTGASAEAGDGQATISFSEPDDDGGSLITSYTVTCTSEDPNTQTIAAGSSSPITVSGLENGTTYVCTVHATNGGGSGPVSNFTIVTPATTPEAPTGVTADRTNGGAQVSFTTPDWDGGSPITGYTATCTVGLTSHAQSGSGSPIQVGGLTNGTEYSCTVRATNAFGDGPESDADAVTPAAVPGAPTDIVATRGDGEASVAFTAPADSGGSEITEYTATCFTSDPEDGETASGASSPLVVDGLDNGTLYACVVHATNDVGDGPISSLSFVTPATTPDAPTDVDAIRADGAAQVSFNAPANDGGSPITSYVATCGTESAEGNASPITVAGLTNGTEVTCTVRAINSVGESDESTGDTVTPAAVPGAPTEASATPGDEQATVTFTPPVETGGSEITGYRVSCVPNDPDDEETATGAGSPITVTDLENGESHVCTVRAENSVGLGPASNFAFVTPATTPDAPTDVDVNRVGPTATVSFTEPDDGGSPITLYTATCTAGLDVKTGTGTSSPITVTNLTIGSSYTCTVRATNAFGDGPESDGFIVGVAIGSLDGTVKDLAAPKGTGAPYGTNAVVGVLVCEESGPPGCASPQNVVATPNTGAYLLADIEEGSYELTPYYCRASSPSCAPGSPWSRVGPTQIVEVNPGGTTTTNLAVGFRPDAQARLLDGTYKGSDTYVTSAAAAPVAAGAIDRTRTFVVRIDNDGNLREAINLQASASGGTRFSFAYGIASRSAPDVARAAGRNIVLDPGESLAVRVTITAKSNALRGNVAQVQFKTTSIGQAGTQKVDFVKIRVTKR